MNRVAAMVGIAGGLLLASAYAQAPAAEAWNKGKEYLYKQTPQGPLKAHLYFPEGWKPGDRRKAIIFFFGGGFRGGSPKQFYTQAEYFASRGMVAASAEYRIRDTHKTDPDASFEDCRSAVAWFRSKAQEFGIDPNGIAGSGGSAGGACVGVAGIVEPPKPEKDKLPASPVPNVLVLYNPVLDLTKVLRVFQTGTPEEKMQRAGAFSFGLHVKKGQPPTILFFGTQDDLGAPAPGFVKEMRAAGNRAELYTAEGQKHGFFNHRGFRNTPETAGWYEACVYQTDLFLTSLGYLEGKPTINPGNRKLEKH